MFLFYYYWYYYKLQQTKFQRLNAFFYFIFLYLIFLLLYNPTYFLFLKFFAQNFWLTFFIFIFFKIEDLFKYDFLTGYINNLYNITSNLSLYLYTRLLCYGYLYLLPIIVFFTCLCSIQFFFSVFDFCIFFLCFICQALIVLLITAIGGILILKKNFFFTLLLLPFLIPILIFNINLFTIIFFFSITLIHFLILIFYLFFLGLSLPYLLKLLLKL